MKRSPESLFENIAQDNEVLQLFKHHSLRVMYLSTMLAKKVGCYDDDLRVAAFLHDIGKIGIAKEILLKPGKLNTIEKTIVESHSHIGNSIVRKELGRTRAAEFIRDHHEDWNGTGYPRRLVGEEISVQGRIIRICDSFDTMTYDIRNYKLTKMSYHEAFEELKRCSWTQFDGNLVETFIDLLIKLELPDSWYDTYDSAFLEKIYKEIEEPTDFL
ncbi:HD-GYP domain-containing protein [Alkalibacillus salilacus]|uniref:Nucleotidyltransferase with HDIG domain n=1 Tax=Alkalibacillus salilacus TaxID=284582 RepID=A0ABT9VB86_9BACI|nr:HD domain-containing phosphohydrolase [Alkalibacillus salilacus]MDQ0158217.1 putative nucleotidyltransferase with HDIG domain [Alkalibacillus salilacus]